MTRRHLALFAAAIVFCGVVGAAPATHVDAAYVDIPARTSRHPTTSVQVGDGIFTLRILMCVNCGTWLTLEINLHLSPDLKVGPTPAPSPDVKVGTSRVGHHSL